MSKRTLTLAVVVLALFFSGTSMAVNYQDTATASATPATAVIVAPISIEKTANLNFGEIVASAVGGTVVLAVNGDRSSDGGVTLANADAGLYPTSAAAFDVAGSPDNSYTIELPEDGDIFLTNGEYTMAVNDFQSSKEDNVGHLSGGGADSFTVGATLSVGTLTENPVGVYQGVFDVTVTYE
jgi:hypothetical protein